MGAVEPVRRDAQIQAAQRDGVVYVAQLFDGVIAMHMFQEWVTVRKGGTSLGRWALHLSVMINSKLSGTMSYSVMTSDTVVFADLPRSP